MTDCDDILDDLKKQTRDHVHLALIAEVPSVAEMHLDLARFSAEQTRIAEEVCVDA